MDKEELTQEEIDLLLGGAPSSGKTRMQPVGRVDLLEAKTVDAFRALHERAADRCADRLSTMLRTAVEVKVARVDQRTYGQFLSSLEKPTCCHVITTKPPSRELLLDVALPILYALIGRLLGGEAERDAPVGRAMTEIELRLASRVVRALLDELQEAWRDVLDLELEATRTESDPQAAELFAPGEVVVVVGFELTCGESRGRMTLCIPSSVIEPATGKLVATRQTAAGDSQPDAQREGSPEKFERIEQAIEDSLVELRVDLARVEITAGELIDLGVGDVITTEQRVDEPLKIDVDGRIELHARLGTFEGKKAIQIEKPIDR
ncbi:MAG: flagellar motor switch protein FliM [Pirellulales bacterium]|nr:flagellar motor switch protein FliM [Pirellulales bacterium]